MKKKWTKKAEPKLCFFFLLLNSKTLIELINSTLSSCCLLVSCLERMALGTNFHVNLRLCGACYEGISTVAGYGCLVVAWMNVFSHIFPLSAWFPTIRIRLSVIGLLGFHKAKSFSWNTIPQKRKRRKSCFHILLFSYSLVFRFGLRWNPKNNSVPLSWYEYRAGEIPLRMRRKSLQTRKFPARSECPLRRSSPYRRGVLRHTGK